MVNSRKDSPVVVTSFLNPNEAYIFRGLLESEGIQSFIYHEHSFMYTPVITDGVRVAVRSKDLARARSLLKEVENKPLYSEINKPGKD